ncbi:hypothetical protein AGMMS50293_28770 [Spirochaetia bacterium]|nr:hypothetical protein AGMMS50293_28770 [Spirochaetia bacterium]
METMHSKIPALIKGGLVFTLGLTIFTLILYTLGIHFTDRTLFLLLRVLRYLAFLVCLFSLCALGFSIRLMIRGHWIRRIPGICLYLLTGTFGAILVIFNSFIIALAGGNG